MILVYTFSTKKAELLVDRNHIHMSQLGEADIKSRTSAVGEMFANSAAGQSLFSHIFQIDNVEVGLQTLHFIRIKLTLFFLSIDRCSC